MKLKVRTLPHGEGLELAYGSRHAAGFDLRAAIPTDEPVVLAPGEIRIIPSGFCLSIPDGFEGQVRSRSGMTLMGIVVANGVGTIDSDYRGEVGIILHNIGKEAFTIVRGDRVAQMVIAKHERARFIDAEHLGRTARGDGGYGSTGQ